MKKKTILIDLLITFLRIGLFTFGGGYAMIPLIEDLCVEKKKWIDHDEMIEITVIAESTPGPIAVNCATFVGYKQAGLLGSIFATLGIIIPSFIVIWLVSRFLDRFLEIRIVANAFHGIKAAVAVLIINAGINILKKLPKNTFNIIIIICSVILMLLINLFSLNFSTISILLIAGALGLIAFMIKKTET
ncbi:MAG: chromate transporter [Lachnospiraceae bacterium]|nr:chromate transporter [Lachnospiraceae bacterium]